MRRIALAPLAVLALATTANAADPPRYGAWQPAPDRAQQLSDELRRLVDEAAKARAADPRFLDDLRALADRYSNPWPVVLIQEDFSDGNFTADPAWTVVSGDFSANPAAGLRAAAIPPTAAAAPAPQPQRKVSREELAAQLLGQLFNQGNTQSRQQETAPASQPAIPGAPAEIFLSQAIPNAFSLKATVSVGAGSGPITLAVFQGSSRAAGYALGYDSTGTWQIERRGSSGTQVLGSKTSLLTDGSDHSLTWTRDGNGQMVVSLDGAELLRAVDTGFRDGWNGVSLSNQTGAMTLRSLTVSGAR